MATISAKISGSAGLTKAGVGILSLTGANTYTGQTNVAGGILRAVEGTGLNSQNLLLSNGAFDPNTPTAFIRNLGTGANEVRLVASVLSNGSFTKSGSGRLSLAGTNTYVGDTTVNEGLLELASTGQLKFDIGLSGENNMLTGTGSVFLDGSFLFDTTDASLTGTWTIVDSGLTKSFGSNFSVFGYTETSAGVWQLDDFTFDEETGVLTAVPEPSSALLAVGGGLACALLRRRRKAV